MYRTRIFVVLAVLAALMVQSPMAEAAKGKKKKKGKSGPVTVSGVITGSQSGANGAGTLTVKVAAAKKKKGAAASGKEETFRLDSSTSIVKMSGKKKGATETPASFADLKTGDKVKLTGSKGSVTKVVVASAKKEKKKKKNK